MRVGQRVHKQIIIVKHFDTGNRASVAVLVSQNNEMEANDIGVPKRKTYGTSNVSSVLIQNFPTVLHVEL